MPCNYNPATNEVETLLERYQRESEIDARIEAEHRAEQARHTPGLWENTGRISDSDSRLLVTSENCDIAIIGHADPVTEDANANLAASAPDILAALVECYEMMIYCGKSDVRHIARHSAALTAARSAIAKANGDKRK